MKHSTVPKIKPSLSEEERPTETLPPMNCLVCRQCQIRPDSDFLTLSPPIFCGKRGEVSPLIVSGCALADPRFEYHGKRVIGGDRQREYHDVADAFLKANYARLPMERLVAVLRRTPSSIYKRAHRLGLTNGERASVMFRRNGLNRRGQHWAWTADQLAFLHAEYTRPTWPSGVSGTIQERANEKAERTRIVAQVTALGTPKSWVTIRNKCCALFTPRGQQAQRAKTQRDARKQGHLRAQKRRERAQEA